RPLMANQEPLMESGCTAAEPIRRELWALCRRLTQVRSLVPARHRRGFALAAVVMALAGSAQVAIPPLLGRLVDEVQRGSAGGLSPGALHAVAALHLALLAGAYLLRESFHVLRRFLVERACASVEKETTVRVVSHLMKTDLATWTHNKVGALH